jgi:hypothetical protein
MRGLDLRYALSARAPPAPDPQFNISLIFLNPGAGYEKSFFGNSELFAISNCREPIASNISQRQCAHPSLHPSLMRHIN